MKIKLRQTSAGPEGCYPAGTIVDLPREQAEELVRSHQAVLVSEEPSEVESAEGSAQSAKEARKRARDEARAKAGE